MDKTIENEVMPIKYEYINNVEFELYGTSDNLPIYDDENINITELRQALKDLSNLDNVDYKNKKVKSLINSLKNFFQLGNISEYELNAYMKPYDDFFDFVAKAVCVSYNQDIWTFEALEKIYKKNKKTLEKPTNTDILYYRYNYSIEIFVGKTNTTQENEIELYVYDPVIENTAFINKDKFYNHNKRIRNLTSKVKALINFYNVDDTEAIIPTTYFKKIPYANVLSDLLAFTSNITPIQDKNRDIYIKGDTRIILPQGTEIAYNLPIHYLIFEALTHINADNTKITFDFKAYLKELGYTLTAENYKKRKADYEYYIWVLQSLIFQKCDSNKNIENFALFKNEENKILNDFMTLNISNDFHKKLYPNKYNDNIPAFIIENGIEKPNPLKNTTIINYIPNLYIYSKNKLAGQLLLKMSLYYNQIAYNKKNRKHYYRNVKTYQGGFRGALLEVNGLLKNTLLENRIETSKDKYRDIILPLENALDFLIDEAYITEWTYRKAKGEILTDDEFEKQKPKDILKKGNRFIAFKQKVVPIIY